ncbi:fungal-specific transcription factor domain-containing protein [Mycena maculata]|uniref:Fungal-specific transcription factor domain-containing protein n=1 Tax=Mycena maculata TaxID=230809 RepID=A0AAD7IK61_9AGAR|nr:fungal-specific transcription factor domain-containing protein [Mycena maculata]
MSLNGNSPARTKKGRPCHMCRQRRKRCDGGTPCGHCIQHEFNCTYQQPATKSASRHLDSSEDRHPTGDSAESFPSHRKGAGIVEMLTQAIRGLKEPIPAPHSDDLGFTEVADGFESLSLGNPGDHGFQGKSSQAMLIKAAVDLKAGHKSFDSSRGSLLVKPWSVRPWVEASPRCTYVFPEDDLLQSLISLYFDNVNTFFPVLHKPTFEKAFSTNTHLRDDGFAGTLLLVCALGARYSEDARVHLSTVTECGTAGWKWFDQVHLAGHPLSGQPTLYDLQCYCLAVQFLDRTSGARACWTLVGFALRLGEDIGAHRSKSRGRMLTSEEELLKRTFWALILLDSQISGALGRTIAIQSPEFDLEMPIRCDDGYWEPSDGNPAFHHHPGTPSLVDFFICQINLNRILSFTQKILYGTSRGNTKISEDDQAWEEKLVMELDSALNTWFNSMPEHLRWDPTCSNSVFFDQSAALFCSYCQVQIMIHRPFIPAIRRSPNPTNFPSLTICNNAARACTRVAETQQRRRPNNPLIFGQTAVFTAGIVLLLNIWGSNREGRAQNADLADVRRCMAILHAQRERWPSVGPLCDTLAQLLKVDHAPTPRRPPEEYEPSPFVMSGPTAQETSSQHGISTLNNTSYPQNPQLSRTWTPATAEEHAWAILDEPLGEAPARAPQVLDGTDAPIAARPDYSQYSEVPFLARNVGDASSYTDTTALWSSAPTGFEVSDWDSYLSSIGDIMQTEFSASS